jgi:hypothetical protein
LRLARIAIWTSNHDNIAVRIADPDFLVTGVRVYMRLDDDARAERAGVCDGAIKVVGFEPEQDTVTRGRRVRIAEVGVVVITPTVQLHQHLAVTDELFIFATAMAALAAQQPPIPSTAGFNVPYGYQRLRLHGPYDLGATVPGQMPRGQFGLI